MPSSFYLTCTFVVLLLASAHAASSNKSPASPPPAAPTNCKLSEPSCEGCDAACGLGLQICTRSVLQQATNGGSCKGARMEARHCVSSTSPSCSLERAPNYDRAAAVTDTEDADLATGVFKATVSVPDNVNLPDTFFGSGFEAVPQVLVTASEAAAEGDGNTFMITAEGTGFSSPLAANDNLIAYMTMLRVDPAKALGLGMEAQPTVISIALESLRCPTMSTWQDAQEIVDAKQYLEAIVMLNHILECKTVAASSESDPVFDADDYNLLGFANRKASEPNFAYSEVFYSRALQLNESHTPSLSYLASLYLETGRQAQADETAIALSAACGGVCCSDLHYLVDDYAAIGSALPSSVNPCTGKVDEVGDGDDSHATAVMRAVPRSAKGILYLLGALLMLVAVTL